MKLRIKREHSTQMSEALLTAAVLSLSGGLQDAYTYLCRGGVFANAQTGNIVLLSVELLEGNLSRAFHYLIPLLFFALGVMVAEEIREYFFQGRVGLHWRQIVVMLEIALLFLVALLPERMNMLANGLVSFSCAIQVQSFRKVDGFGFSSTMCIGNLRSGMEAFCIWRRTGNSRVGKKAGEYLCIILLFALGAGLGGVAAARMGLHAILLSCVLLLICFLLMILGENQGNRD